MIGRSFFAEHVNGGIDIFDGIYPAKSVLPG